MNDQSVKPVILILFSYHHKNTEKIAHVFAKVLDAYIQSPLKADPEEIQQVSLVGFGSGIYSEQHHKTILDFTDKLTPVTNKKAFIFSTDGAPRGLIKDDHPMAEEQLRKNHRKLKERLISKGYVIVGEFNCGGWNTNSFLKLFGGINKEKPNAEDLQRADQFAQKLKQYI